MIAYKVVRYYPFEPNVFYSSSADFPLCYKPNIPTVPKLYDGPLCAFESFEDALNFYNWNKSVYTIFKIFECNVEEDGIAKGVWLDCVGHTELADLPANTVLCSSITLLKEMTGLSSYETCY